MLNTSVLSLIVCKRINWLNKYEKSEHFFLIIVLFYFDWTLRSIIRLFFRCYHETVLYFNVLSELPLADEFGARMELEVKTLILFFNEDKQIPFCKEKSLLKIKYDDIFRELNKFKRYVENYCGIQQSSAEKGLGPNIAVKLARQVKDAKGVESFCINTQLQWDNERSTLADPCSMLQGTTTELWSIMCPIVEIIVYNQRHS